MTDAKNDTTGDKIIKAREDERLRITRGRPAIKTEIGWGGPGSQAYPTFTLTITGGDPDKLFALGQNIATDALAKLPTVAAPESAQ